jgi:hypothetical protein
MRIDPDALAPAWEMPEQDIGQQNVGEHGTNESMS